MANIAELNKQIQQLTTSIEAAKTQLAELEQILSSGAFQATKGFGPTAAFEQARIAAQQLATTIKELSSQRVTLIDQKNEQQIQSLNRAIATVQEKLTALKEQRGTLVNAEGDLGPLRQIDVAIKKAESSLASFEARLDKVQARSAIGKVAQGYIPGGDTPTGGGYTPTQPEGGMNASRYNESELLAMTKSAKSLEDLAKVRQLAAEKQEQDTPLSDNAYRKLIGAMEQQARVLEVETNLRTENLRKVIAQYGFAPEDVTRVQSYAGGAQKVYNFSKTGPLGETQTGRFGVDQGGNVTQSYIPRQNQTFGQGIFRDFAELTKWSIAISLLYAPLNALNTALTKMIENQAKLAQVSIAVNSSIATQGQVFDNAAKIAQQMGEDVGGVIDAFDQAYRAAGATSEGIQKYTTANKLLADSITLAKISTLDQSQAIDYLSAALLQTNRPLTDGAHLLDEWVLVSKNANVTIGDLAQAVATIGGSAETAGLSIEQLNSVVAALSQATPLTGASLTNAVKALIGQYQTPEATKALQNYGIAVKDMSGKTREFLDVMGDVARLRQTGILGEQDFNTLTLALGGGGIRNQKNVQAFINNFGRIQALTNLQTGSNAQGQAADALSKKLDTVQTAATRLSNAFQELGQSLGVKGGLLDDFTLIINLATKLVDVLTSLSNVLGKTGPLLAGVGIAGLIGKYGGGIGIGNIFGGLGGGIGGGINPLSDQEKLAGGSPLRNIRTAALTTAAIAVPALGNIAQKDYAAAGGDIAGGIVGALATKGSPIGTLIGTAVGEAFINAVFKSKDTLADAFTPAIKTGAQQAQEGLKQGQQPTIEQLFTGLGSTLNFAGGVKGRNLPPFLQQLIGTGFANTAFAAEQFPLGKSIFGGVEGQRPATASAFALQYLKQYNPQLYQVYGAYGAPQQTIEQKALTYQTPENLGLLTGLQYQRQTQLRQQVTAGELQPTDYAQKIQSLGGYTVTATQYMAAFGNEFKKLDPNIKNATDEYQAFLDIVVGGGDEQKATINSMIADINKLQGVVDNWNPKSKDITFTINGEDTKFASKKAAQAQLDAQREALAMYARQVQTTALAANANLPAIYGSVQPGQGRTTTDIQLIQKTAQQMALEFYKSNNVPQETITALQEGADKFSVYTEDAGKTFYTLVEKTGQKWYGDAEKYLEKIGKIQTPTEGIGIQGFQTTRPILESLAAQSMQLGKLYQQQYNYNFTPDTVLANTTDGITKPITADLKILAILLQALNDKAQKQLDGMYNIPEGATFWVPITAAYYRPQGQGAGGIDLSQLNEALNPNTTETTKNTTALQDLTAKISSGELAKQYGGQLPSQLTGRNLWLNLSPDEYKLAFQKEVEKSALNYAYTGPIPQHIDESQRAQMKNYSGLGIDESQRAAMRPTPPVGLLEQFPSIDELLKAIMDKNAPLTVGSERAGGDVLKILDTIGTFFNNLLGMNKQPAGTVPLGATTPTAFNINNTQNAQPLTTKLDLRLDNTTTLMVDGRVLAQIIKPYLAADLLQMQQTQGTIVRQYII